MKRCEKCGRSEFIEVVTFKLECTDIYNKEITYRCFHCGHDIESGNKQSTFMASMWVE